ncbi:hypothetical protein AC230_24760 [Streptomyces caatingaensis]|uniref:Peptidase inhibitor family I36 protein n=1 Tax=Streptomyces caatingaensis TaxID=1678637 RepID=A0A0K9X9Q5_9ACTN|nr:hypothetical protein AC230_24760 [Streptomyces caatingaensis]
MLALASGTVVATSSSASAGTAYEWDLCNSGNGSCFGIFYSSVPGSLVIDSACFLANRSVPDHWGRYENGGTIQVRYQFRNQGYNGGPLIVFDRVSGGVAFAKCLPNGAGAGDPLKNNAASAVNQDTVPHTIYYNSGYGGQRQTINSGRGYNIIAELKNNNASSLRG